MVPCWAAVAINHVLLISYETGESAYWAGYREELEDMWAHNPEKARNLTLPVPSIAVIPDPTGVPRDQINPQDPEVLAQLAIAQEKYQASLSPELPYPPASRIMSDPASAPQAAPITVLRKNDPGDDSSSSSSSDSSDGPSTVPSRTSSKALRRASSKALRRAKAKA